MVETLKANKKLKLKIWAHTDSRATVAYNQTLSNQRALSVKNYLISKGIQKNQIIEMRIKKY